MFARACVLVLAVGLVGLPGCGPARLDETRKWSLEPGEALALELPAQPVVQTLTVQFDATADDVTVAIFKVEDAKNLYALDVSKALAKQQGKSGTVTVEIPEKTATQVVGMAAMKKAEVNIHVTNKK